ncbi:MAG TPA: flagellar FlbD family protein [Candidatus Dorea gallistercoris]|uniref:Flagellar FlbD family protein n=1 Tax=Candidatus Dorea gallistercoris TaxID=2838542 RepID=A0A9D1UDT3_9FIRM|nr:flagellar FlbD family protein [Candidatus Dorea gallistercoris]
MVEFTKLNGKAILINPFQIEYVELIPDSKIIMMNGHFHIVKENEEEIIQKITEYRREICQRADSEV